MLLTNVYTVNANTQLVLYIDGKIVHTKAPLIKKDNAIMIPLREVSELLGYQLYWKNGVVNGFKNDKPVFVLTIDDKNLELNENMYFEYMDDKDINWSTIKLYNTPILYNNCTMVAYDFFVNVYGNGIYGSKYAVAIWTKEYDPLMNNFWYNKN
jgi:capsule polysaccharide modification protein KpsS